MLSEGVLSAGHARALVTAADPLALARQIVAQGLSVRATELLVKKEAKSDGTKSERPSQRQSGQDKDADTRALEGDLSAALGMRVQLDHNPGNDGGTLSIQYKSFEQLDDLCQILGGN